MRIIPLALALCLFSTTAFASADQTTNVSIGAKGETACTTDTASCSLNQLLQRIAQRLSTLISTGPTTSSVVTSVVSGSGESSHVLKSSAGTLFSAYATNLTATAGFLVIINATAAPGDGAITPLDCAPLPANGVANINYRAGPFKTYTTGITAVVTSAVTCFTKTTGVITAFMSGDVQ